MLLGPQNPLANLFAMQFWCSVLGDDHITGKNLAHRRRYLHRVAIDNRNQCDSVEFLGKVEVFFVDVADDNPIAVELTDDAHQVDGHPINMPVVELWMVFDAEVGIEQLGNRVRMIEFGHQIADDQIFGAVCTGIRRLRGGSFVNDLGRPCNQDVMPVGVDVLGRAELEHDLQFFGDGRGALARMEYFGNLVRVFEDIVDSTFTAGCDEVGEVHRFSRAGIKDELMMRAHTSNPRVSVCRASMKHD